MAKKYDIIVHDQDPDIKPEKQDGLVAESPEALSKMFKMCGQSIEIVREYEDDESRSYGKPKQLETPENFEFANGGGVGAATGFMKVDPSLPQYNPTNKIDKQNDKSDTTLQTKPEDYKEVYKITKSEPPRYFDIGGIKCKMENGKMYQKQWMRLSDKEASEFRIVSDKNNKICPIKDKHIEVMKWVLIEDENTNVVQSEEKPLELING